MNSGCNECNEALDDARRLAMVAMSALMNGDSHRTRNALRQLQDVLAARDQAPAGSLSDRRRAEGHDPTAPPELSGFRESRQLSVREPGPARI